MSTEKNKKKEKYDNRIYDSEYRNTVYEWYCQKQSPEQIRRSLASLGFEVSTSVIYKFIDIVNEKFPDGLPDDLAEINAQAIKKGTPTVDFKTVDSLMDIPENERVKRDGILLDLIIANVASMLKKGSVPSLTVGMALKAIDLKRSMMGTEYKGLTIWALMDIQKSFDDVIDIINKYVDRLTFDRIVTALEESGYVRFGAPDTVKKEISRLDKDIDKELIDYDGGDDNFD